MTNINQLSQEQIDAEILEKASSIAEYVRDLFGWDVLSGKELTNEDLRAMPVWQSASLVFDLARNHTSDGDLYETDHPANLDNLDALVADNRLQCGGGAVVVRQLLDWINAAYEWEQGENLTLKAAAELAGMTIPSIRNVLSKEKSGLTAVKNSDGRTVVRRDQFEQWVQGRRNFAPLRAGSVAISGVSSEQHGKRPDRTAVEELLRAMGWELHPMCDPTNSKMLAWKSADGSVCIGHEHNLATTQNLWVRPDQLPKGGEWTSIPHDKYSRPDGTLSAAKDYGRHSGLKKYPELVMEPLLKFQPRTVAEAAIVLQSIAELSKEAVP